MNLELNQIKLHEELGFDFVSEINDEVDEKALYLRLSVIFNKLKKKLESYSSIQLNTKTILTNNFVSQPTINAIIRLTDKNEATIFDIMSDIVSVQNSLEKDIDENSLHSLAVIRDYFVAHKLIDEDHLNDPLFMIVNLTEVQKIVEQALKQMNKNDKEKLFVPIPDFATGYLSEEDNQ